MGAESNDPSDQEALDEIEKLLEIKVRAGKHEKPKEVL